MRGLLESLGPRSVAFRLNRAVLLLLAAVATAFCLHSVASERNALLSQLRTTARSMAKAIAVFCPELVLTEDGTSDKSILVDCVRELCPQDGVVKYAWVRRSKGDKIVAEFPAGASALAAQDRGCVVYEADIVPPEMPGHVVGKAGIALSLEDTERLLRARTLALVQQSAITFLLLAVLIGVLVRRAIGQPLKRLDGQALALGMGDLTTPIESPSRDELGRLALTLDTMRANLLRSYTEIQQKNQKLLDVDRLKSQFMANVSHEIRTPMNGIVGMTELLLETELSTDQKEFVSIINSSSEALLEIINGILDFSKLEAGHVELAQEDFDLRGCVEDVIELMAPRARAKRLELCCLVDPDADALVHADKGRLRQVLVNLIGNAVKFTDQGEVVVRVRRVAVAGEFHEVRFEIQDSGIGIDQEAMGRLFKPFSQADGSLTRKYGGTGLGLAISRQLVEMMGGEIGVASEPGRGSTFWFGLKLRRSERPRGATGTAPAMDGLRVLCVDDHPTNRVVIERQLLGFNLRAVTAADGATALALLRAARDEGRPFALVISDLFMPGMDGVALVQALHAEPGLAELPVILLGSGSYGECAAMAARVGVPNFLLKPVRQSRLIQAVLDAVRGPAKGAVAGAHEAAVAALPAPVPLPALPAPAPVPTPAPAAAVPWAGGRMLVVDDNEVNIRVAVRSLQCLGIQSDTACNGAEAVARVEANRYAAILMDCQMPVMDGFEATRAIRRLVGSSYRLPILGITANAMKEVPSRCLEAGMDVCLIKPVRVDVLRAALQQVGAIAGDSPTPTPQTPPALAASGPEATAGSDEAAILERLRELGMLEPPEVAVEMVDSFLASAGDLLARLERALAASDAAELRAAAHTLKGAAASLGAERMAACARAMERKHPAEDRGELTSRLAEARTCLQAVREFSQTRLQPSAAAPQ